ncbi:MAG TPA: hypothetical protein VFX76_00560 [Roseiflexaceae bacterium]|nr:hypothetical protein [Roseiflexaceae bacterium]
MNRATQQDLARSVRQALSNAATRLEWLLRRWQASFRRASRRRSNASPASHGRQAVPGKQEQQSAPSEQYFDRLLDQVDPQRPAYETSIAQARIYAGRWLALRRIRHGLSDNQIENRTGIVSPTLLLLEAGLADETLAPAAAWEKLGAALAGRRRAAPNVAAVVDVALGRANTMRSLTMAQVGNDLRHLDRVPRDVVARALRGTRALRKHRRGLALLGLLAGVAAFWHRRQAASRRPFHGRMAQPPGREAGLQHRHNPAWLHHSPIPVREPAQTIARRSRRATLQRLETPHPPGPPTPRRSGDARVCSSEPLRLRPDSARGVQPTPPFFADLLVQRLARRRTGGILIDVRLSMSHNDV